MTRAGWDIPVSVRIERCADGADPRAAAVREAFGFEFASAVEVLYEGFHLRLRAGEVVAVVGPSGCGKTTLLRAVAAAVPEAIVVDPARLARSAKPAVAVVKGDLPARLEILSRCGLAEAGVLVTPARRLSGGQRHRLALAVAIARAVRAGGPRLVLIDEFASTLDATTAEVLAGQIPRLARRFGLGMVVATVRQHLLGLLRPAAVVVKPLGEPPRVVRVARADAEEGLFSPGPARPRDWPIVAGTIRDYRALGRFHYVAGPPAAHKRVWVVPVPSGLRRLGDPVLAAVLVVSPPVLNCRGRNLATGGRFLIRRAVETDRRLAAALLNAELECISRVVVHPTYRGCGLAVRLVRHALATAATPLVEALATMGAVHPFFERAGMTCFGRVRGRTRTYSYYLAPSARATLRACVRLVPGGRAGGLDVGVGA